VSTIGVGYGIFAEWDESTDGCQMHRRSRFLLLKFGHNNATSVLFRWAMTSLTWSYVDCGIIINALYGSQLIAKYMDDW